jgi:hypothetical protein
MPDPEDDLDVGCPAVAEADPNHFPRGPSKEAVLNGRGNGLNHRLKPSAMLGNGRTCDGSQASGTDVS